MFLLAENKKKKKGRKKKEEKKELPATPFFQKNSRFCTSRNFTHPHSTRAGRGRADSQPHAMFYTFGTPSDPNFPKNGVAGGRKASHRNSQIINVAICEYFFVPSLHFTLF